MTDKLALNVTEGAAALGISRQSMYNLMNTDETFPAFKVGGRTLISKSGLEAWIKAKTEKEVHK